MKTRLVRTAALLAALGAILAAAAPSATPATASFDYDPDIHTGLSLDVTGQGLVSGTSGEDGTPGCHPTGSGRCHVTYLKNSVVNLHAEPDPGWIFAGWSGCTQVSGTYCQLYMAEKPDTTYDVYWVYATFTKLDVIPVKRPLSVTVDGPGRVSGPGIDCPGDCSQDIAAGAWVTLTAQAGPLAAFLGWSGACTGGPTTACVVQMDEARNVTATFAADVPIGVERTLTVDLGGSGGGSVKAGSAIDCPGDCSQTYSVDASVALTANPAAGSDFAGWSGACVGSSPTCTVTMAGSRSVTATFVLAPAAPGQPAPGDPGTPGAPGAPGQPAPGGPIAEETCTVRGTPGNDVLVGTPGRDVICGLGGNDTLVGRSGDDILVGGNGADRLLGGAGNDYLLGGAGRDRVLGARGRDVLHGGSGSDRLVGGPGRDRLVGGTGNDLLLARDGARDRANGGRGRDRARLDRADRRFQIEALV